MDFSYIEMLVKKAKDGDSSSSEKLAHEFQPFIINISKKTFIDGYDFQDIMNECYKILFRCVEIYDTSRNRFVAYATNGIKNSIYYLVTKSIKFSSIHGKGTEILSDDLIHSVVSPDMSTEDLICKKCDLEPLKYALDKLNPSELQLIENIYFKGMKVKDYASTNNISYSYATKKKRAVLDKMYMHINKYSLEDRLNS